MRTLNNLRHFSKTIHDKDFKNYEDGIQNWSMSAVIKSEHNNVRFEHHLLKLFLSNDAEKDLISNGFFIMKKRKHATDNCKSLKH